MVDLTGVEPVSYNYQLHVFPLNYRSIGEDGGIRTHQVTCLKGKRHSQTAASP